jgi:hypothetical protein
MWSRPPALPLFLMAFMACGGSRSEDVAESPPPRVATDTGVTAGTTDTGVTARTTDTVVTTRTIIDTTLVTMDTTIVVDTTITVDTTATQAGRGEIIDTAR